MFFNYWTAFVPVVIISDEPIVFDLLFAILHMLLVVVSYIFLSLASFEGLHKETMIVYRLHLNL